jgi:hypothetical protein
VFRSWNAALLLGSASLTGAAWLAFCLVVPAWVWTERSLPFQEIERSALHLGPLSTTALLLLVLLLAYAALMRVVRTSAVDLPLPIVLATAAVSGVGAVLTYALFAEDVNLLLAFVWNWAVGGVNPYEVAPASMPGNPYAPFTAWAELPAVYGPIWLIVGALQMRLLGPGLLANVLATKCLMLATLWPAGALTWALARSRGASKPVGAAALVLWNPLLLAEGPMTPHVDLPMAVAVLAGLLAWSTRREALALFLFALSAAVKLITGVLMPVVLFGIATSAVRAVNGRRRRIALLTGVSVALAAALAVFWSAVWGPYLSHGFRESLTFSTKTALLPNLIAAFHAATGRPPVPQEEVRATARIWRWFAYWPLWADATVCCALLAWRRPRAVPHLIVEPLAALLLAFHVLFTTVVQPWHFTTALLLCLASPGRRAQMAALLITTSCLLYYAGGWVWDHPWPDSRWIGWILGAILLSGPVAAGITLVAPLIRAAPRALARDAAATSQTAPDPGSTAAAAATR